MSSQKNKFSITQQMDSLYRTGSSQISGPWPHAKSPSSFLIMRMVQPHTGELLDPEDVAKGMQREISKLTEHDVGELAHKKDIPPGYQMLMMPLMMIDAAAAAAADVDDVDDDHDDDGGDDYDGDDDDDDDDEDDDDDYDDDD